jgi:hypothetical protein
MAAFKKRSTAALVAVVVIVLGTLFGVHRSISSQTAKIEKMFYNGVTVTDSVTKSTYVQPSIQSQLDKRQNAAMGLVSVASNYGDLKDLTDTLRSARLELVDATSIPAKFTANEKMQAAYVRLYSALSQHGLKDNEKASSMSYAETLNGAQGVIEKSDYNKQVTAFRRSLNGFPVNILKNLAFVKYPDAFGFGG